MGLLSSLFGPKLHREKVDLKKSTRKLDTNLLGAIGQLVPSMALRSKLEDVGQLGCVLRMTL